ncbi:MAG: hypothetical protein K6E85_11445 [Lachnospiraceae bacterium]|nr:hypothetical protein [Lachnospiraceae bacterium]
MKKINAKDQELKDQELKDQELKGQEVKKKGSGKKEIGKKETGKRDEKKLTEIVFILDRSGSMGGLESDTIGGYNSMLEKQKNEEGDAIITTVLFDDRIEVLHDRVPLKKVKPITGKEYFVRGSTALLDAIGTTINHIKNVQKEAEDEEDNNEVPEKTLFIITTDGMENASREFNYDKVKKLVEKQKKKDHWEFIFLGANIDAVKVAGRFGVAANRAVRYECDSVGTALNFDVMSKMVSCARACPTAELMEDAFDSDEMLAPIQADYKKRHK